MELEHYFKVQLLVGPVNEALQTLIPGWQSNDAAKRLYRRFNKPDKAELHQLLRDARDSDTQSQQELIEKLVSDCEIELI